MLARALRLAALVTLATLVGSCAALQGAVKKPKVNFQTARFSAADFETLKMDLVFNVSNPNPIGVKMAGYSMNLKLDEITLLDGDVNEALDLRPNQQTQLVLPAVIRWKEIIAQITKGIGDEIPYSVGGTVRFDTPLGRVGIPMKAQGNVPVVKPPLVIPADLKVVKSSLSAVELQLALDVTNPTARAMNILGFSNAVTIAGRKVVDSTLDEALAVTKKGTTRRNINIRLGVADVGMALLSAITGGRSLDIGVAGGATIDTGFGKIPWSYAEKTSLKP